MIKICIYIKKTTFKVATKCFTCKAFSFGREKREKTSAKHYVLPFMAKLCISAVFSLWCRRRDIKLARCCQQRILSPSRLPLYQNSRLLLKFAQMQIISLFCSVFPFPKKFPLVLLGDPIKSGEMSYTNKKTVQKAQFFIGAEGGT